MENENLKTIDDIARICDMIMEQRAKQIDEAMVTLLSSDEPLVWTNLGIMTEAQYNKLMEERKNQRCDNNE